MNTIETLLHIFILTMIVYTESLIVPFCFYVVVVIMSCLFQ